METQLSLTHDGVEMVAYPNEISHQVAEAARTWEVFTKLPDATKQLFAASSSRTGRGYERKGDATTEGNDFKENFDITKDSLATLTNIECPDEAAREFIESTHVLFSGLEKMIAAYGQHVEESYGIVGFTKEAVASAPFLYVRFLRYPPKPVGTLLGEPHVDRSGVTFHLYESTGGCERLTLDGHLWLPMPVEERRTAAFPSMQAQLLSHCAVRGLCHRIIANDVTASVGRTAIVCFVPLITIPTTTNRRMQELTPGFNYDMSYDEFTRYFN